MTGKQFDKLEDALVKNIEYLSERMTDAAEAEALAAVVQALVSLVEARQSVQAGQRVSG